MFHQYTDYLYIDIKIWNFLLGKCSNTINLISSINLFIKEELNLNVFRLDEIILKINKHDRQRIKRLFIRKN